MKPLKIHTQTGICEIIADESVENLKNQLRGEKYVIITDKNVRRFYSDLFSGNPIIEIGLGERIKTLRTVKKIYQKFLELEMDRSSFVIGIGGGNQGVGPRFFHLIDRFQNVDVSFFDDIRNVSFFSDVLFRVVLNFKQR